MRCSPPRKRNDTQSEVEVQPCTDASVHAVVLNRTVSRLHFYTICMGAA